MTDPIQLLQRLIACPSVTPNDAGCQDIVAEILSAAGFNVERLNFNETSNLWAKMGDGPVRLCFNGHTDVVPPGDGWTSNPFEAVERDGLIIGRGACDMKSGVAAMVCALEKLATEGKADGLALLLTSDEEGSSVDGTSRALDYLIDRGEVIESALVGEPTSLERYGDFYKPGRRGSLTGVIKVFGVQGHVAYPDRADNAAHLMAPILHQLVVEQWDAGDEFFPPTSMQVFELTSGVGASNVIPGEARLGINFRHAPASSADSLMDRVEAILRNHGVAFEADWWGSASPFLSQPARLAAAIQAAVPGVQPSTGGGTSDARAFAARGIEVAEFGVVPIRMHGIDEAVSIDQVRDLTRVFAEIAS